jgi:hypothetical protein
MTSPGRAASLDLFKTLLVVGMVTIHVYQLLGRSLPDWVERLSEFINLITFSGFLLAMGIGVGMAAERKRGLVQRLRPVVLLLLAAWVSAFGFALLVDRLPLTSNLAIDLMTFRRLFGWSEFLATFFVLYLLLALARPIFVRMGSDPVALGLALALSAASTWIVSNLEWPVLATIAGTTRFASFPLLPYLMWFVLGVALARSGGKLLWWHWLVALVATGVCFGIQYQTGALPGRFPPTLAWVAGAAFPLAVYWWGASKVTARLAVPSWLLLPGRHVLTYLLLSNLVIFAARRVWGRPIADVGSWLAVSLAILIVLGAGWWVWERFGTRARVSGQPAPVVNL